MNSLQEESKQIQSSIALLNEDLKSKKEQLSKLKNENTMKYEKILWMKEKNNKLILQEKELVQQKKALWIEDQEEGQKNKINMMAQQSKLESLLQADKYDKKFLEIMNGYLDKTNRDYTRLGSKQQSVNDQQDYINPYPVINVKLSIEGMGHEEIIVMRLDENTLFSQIKETAFYFWKLDQANDQEVQSEQALLDKLELIGQDQALIPIQDNVFTFYQSRGQLNLNQITLLLKRRTTLVDRVSSLQQESIKIVGGKGYNDILNRIDIFTVKVSKEKLVDPYNLFFDNLPGLRQFIDEDLIRKQEADRLEAEENQKKLLGSGDIPTGQSFQHLYEVDDSHCCILSCILCILFLTLIQYDSFLPSKIVFQKVQAFKDLFELQADGVFLNITNKNQFYDYLENYIGTGLLNSESAYDIYRENNELIGPFRLRQLKMPSKECENYVQNYSKQSCFYNTYDQSNEYKQPIANVTDINHDWQTFQTAHQHGSVYEPNGNLASYSGGGYVKDFLRDSRYEVFLHEVDELKVGQFIDDHTAALFLTFASVAPTTNIWIYLYLTLERNILNQLIPIKPEILIFIPNLHETNKGSDGLQFFILDIMRVALASILLVFTFYSLKRKRDKTHQWDMSYLIVEVGALNIFVSMLTIASFGTALLQSYKGLSSQDLVNTNAYVDLYNEVYFYNLTFILQGCTLLAILIRMSVLFKLDDNLNLIFQTLNQALIQILTFIVLLMPQLIGFALAFQQLWGSYYSEYTTLVSAFAQTILLCQALYDLERLQQNPDTITPVFIVIFYFFVIFFIVAIIQAFLIESYRTVIMYKGYPQPGGDGLNFKTVFRWFFSWIYVWIDRPEGHDQDTKHLDPLNSPVEAEKLLAVVELQDQE